MKTLHLLSVASLVAAASLLNAAGVDSRISAVTVYADRAVATRTASLELPAGEHTLTFEQLPASLLENSLQAAGRGTASTTILDVSARNQYVDFTPNERIKSLEDELKGLQKQLAALDDKSRSLDEQRTVLTRIEAAATSPGTKEAPRPYLDEMSKALDYLIAQRTRIATEASAIVDQKESLQLKINALENQLGELRGPGQKQFKTVTLRIANATAGRLDLSLSYAIPGAAWAPSYNARLKTAERAVVLDYFGVVTNNTGEDWKNVALTLSTARPNLGGGAPNLPVWFVDVARPQQRAKGMVMQDAEEMSRFNSLAKAPAPMTAGASMFIEEAKDASFAQATVSTSTTSATFKIATPTSLPSDNTAQKVPITSTKLAAKLQYEASPKLRETAFLAAYVENTTEYPFLAGRQSVFLDDTFVATSNLKTVMPGEKFELALGADEAVAIKRKLNNRFTEDTGLTSKGRRTSYDILITVTNNKPTAERVVFKEVVPISRDEKIEVKIAAPAEKDLLVTREADGRLVWRVDMKPGEKREFPVKFSIEHPADLPVSGVE